MDHIQAQTFHARRGGIKNSFRYGVDFLMVNFPDTGGPKVFSMDRFNLWHVSRHNHGGAPGKGRGEAWFRDVLRERGFPVEEARLALLAQPSFLWFHFNPVCFWIAWKDDAVCAIVAEVNSTFGQRHCYFCANPDFRPIQKGDAILADKLMHVSPFQTVAGQYRFNFEISDSQIDIRISYENGAEGVLATLKGPRRRATSGSLLWAALRRPFGSARVVALIHWQALILYLKRAPFLNRQPPPSALLSDSKIEGRHTP